MIRRPPRSTRTDTLFPYTTLFRSAITRRVAEHRRGEKEVVRDTASARELSEAKLSLLNAQVEPHFLYKTLASAQALTRSVPPSADAMLGHLIAYPRRSRSEARRVGEASVSRCRSRGSPHHNNKKQKNNNNIKN